MFLPELKSRAMPLIRKIIEPLTAVSKKEEREEDTLFLRLRDIAEAQRDVYACTVQGADTEFVVVLSDPESGKELCAWSGSADAVVVDFQHTLSACRAAIASAWPRLSSIVAE